MTPKSKTAKWEVEFDKEFKTKTDCTGSDKHSEYCQGCIDLIIEEPRDIKDFIRQILSSQKQEFKKMVEGMSREYFETHKELMYAPYNQALSDLLKKLEEKKRR